MYNCIAQSYENLSNFTDSKMDYIVDKHIPFEFILDHLYQVSPVIKRMFGCVAIYVNDKMVLALRQRDDHPEDNGLWVVTDNAHHHSLKQELPSLRTIQLFGAKISSWQLLSEDLDDFEELALQVCDLILLGDNRIGKKSK